MHGAAPVFRNTLARVGSFALAFVCLALLTGPALPADLPSISVADTATVTAAPLAPEFERVRELARAEVLGAESTPGPTIEPTPTATPEPTPRPTPVRTPAPVATLPQLPDPPTAGIVIASWYGPGFYGNRTACGQTYTPEIIGVAHRTLPCGTLVVLEYRGRTMTVPVIDRGPYIAGRTLDLSAATKIAMGCPDLCTLSMRIAR